jgi:putative ABC transport system permease protein
VLSDILYRLRALVRRRTVDRELADELRFHLERETEKHVAAGMSHAEAERRARLDFGGITQVTEDCREARGVTFVETLLQDLRYSIRTMRRSPAFSSTAIGTIALATAAIATVASLGDTLLWRRPAVADAETLVAIGATRGRGRTDGAVSYPDYVAFRDRATTVSGLAAHYSTAPLFVAVDGNAREVNGAVVSASYFPLLGLQPALGRFFRDEEDRVPDRDHVAIVGYGFWQSWLGGASTVLGSTLSINGVPFTVIGVAPAHPVSLTPLPVELYIPTMMLRVGYRWCNDSLAGDCTTLSMIGRLARGRPLAEAQAEFNAIMPAAWRTAPIGQNRGVALRQPRGMSEDDREPQLVGTLAAVAVLLLIVCCANLAGLLSAQSAAREAEFGIRLSLGAGPLRIVRQLMTESLLLSVVGGIAGLLLSRIFIGVLARLLFSMDDEGHPLYYDFSPSTAVLVATAIAALAAGVLFSLVPAVRAVRQPAGRAASVRTTSAQWSTGRWLLGAQAAVAVAMMATAALLASSAREVLAGRNYETSHVALIRLRPRLLKYTPDRAQQFQRQVIRQLLALPSVESASMVGVGTVLSGGSANASLPAWPAGQHLAVGYNEVGPAYFATIRTPILAGREFDDRDTIHSAPVAIVNQTMASRLWPDGRVIGSTVIVENRPRDVVGVVADVSLKGRNEPADPWIFTPFWQNPGAIDSRVAVRSAGDPAALLPELTRVVHQIDPAVPIAETITLPIRMAGLTRPLRVAALFVGYAASLAVVLTAIGLYGALAFAVSRRTKEIGIRLALGAARAHVVRSIVGEGLPVVLSGSAIGVLLAMVGSRIVSHLLYGSPNGDWLFYAAAAGVVICVGVGASLLPARRAATVDPIVALRQE